MSLQKYTFTTVDKQTREAMVYLPAVVSLINCPILFAFHGHGSVASGFATKKAFEADWPACIVVYPQGLDTKSGGDKTASETGWQHSVGEVNSLTNIKDQDLKFFDAMMETFAPNINPKNVCVHGFSNGGEFVYDVLWTARAEKLFILSGASAILNTTSGKKPISVLHIAGQKDPVVPFAAQEKAFETIKLLNKCSQPSTPWANDASTGLVGTHFGSLLHDPVVFIQHNGGHEYPDTIPFYVTRFFKNRVNQFNISNP